MRESVQSWKDVLQDLLDRGLIASRLAIGDGALGFWGAVEEVFPETRQPAEKAFDAFLVTYATNRHRTDRSRGCVTKESILTMIFKLGLCAGKKWRKIRGFKHLATILEGRTFKDGILDESDQKQDAA